MAENKILNIMDVTIKEGGFKIHHRIHPEQVADLAQELERAGVRYAEISHGCGIGALSAGLPGQAPDKDLLTAARLAAPKLKISIYVHPSFAAISEISPLLKHFDIARVGVNFNEAWSAKDHIDILKKHDKMVIGEILRGHSGSPEDVAQAGLELKKQGCDILYLTDSFGSMDENEVRTYLQELQEKVDLTLGFQARNHLGRAIANSLTAVAAGVQWIDGALMGFGEGPGLAPLETLVLLLQNQGLAKDHDLRELTLAAKNYALPVFGTPKGIRFIDLLTAKYKIDFYPNIFLENLADIMDVPLETFFKELREANPGLVQVREPEFRNLLAKHHLDYEVVLEFMQTGKIPS